MFYDNTLCIELYLSYIIFFNHYISSFVTRSVRLLESLQPNQLKLLMESFFKQCSVTSKHNRRVCDNENTMNVDELLSALKEVTGKAYPRNDVEKLFSEASRLTLVVLVKLIRPYHVQHQDFTSLRLSLFKASLKA